MDGDACYPRCDVERSWIVAFLSDAMSKVLAKRERWKVEKKKKERRLKTRKKWMGRKCERKEKKEEKEESSAKVLGTSKKDRGLTSFRSLDPLQQSKLVSPAFER